METGFVNCVLKDFFQFDHFDDDHDFMKCFEVISQSSDIVVRLQNNTKIFNPYDVNEDDNDIMMIKIPINVISMNIHINYLKILITILTIISISIYPDTLSLTTHFQFYIWI